MFKKLSIALSALTLLSALVACNSTTNSGVQRAETWQPRIKMPGSVVVCRSKQCAPSKISMSKEYIYNSLLHLLDNNSQSKALICKADSASHVCTENYITLPITVGVTPANMYIDSVKISDVSVSLGSRSLNLLLNYNVSYNGQYPLCKPAQTLIYVKNTNNIIMEDAGYMCKMTTIGNTTIKTLFAIDYIDLDYGYIGGYYSIGLSGPAYGGESGYMMLRLPKDAYPLAPTLTSAEDLKPIKAEIQPNMPVSAANSSTMQKARASAQTKAKAKPKAETYQGVQIFPIAPKKKTPQAEPATQSSEDKSQSTENKPKSTENMSKDEPDKK